jgi:hypothetical protein
VSATSATCKHVWIRYVLDDSEASRAQQDGVDAHGRPYREIPMMPQQAYAYAATIGSTFASRVVEATCRDCGADVLAASRKELS